MARRTFSYPISLAIVVATLIAITGGFIAWWNYRTGVDNVRQLAGRVFDQIARETKSQTEAFLMRAPPAAEVVASLAAREPTTDDHSLDRCISVLRANPGFKWVTYSLPDGKFMGAYREGAAIRINRSHLVDGKTIVDEHEIQPDGSLKLIKHEDDGKYDPRTRPFWALASSTPTGGAWTAPYGFNEGVPGITYTIAVRDKAGAVTGVFTIDFHLSRLVELSRELQFSQNGRVVITTADNIALGHPLRPVVRKGAAGIELVPVKDLGDPAMSTVIAKGPGVTSFDLDGEPYLVRTQPIETNGWNVTVYAPESDFTAMMRGRAFTSLLISALAVLLAVGVAWLIARRVSGPLTALSDEMVKVGGLHLEDSAATAPSMFREIDMMNTSLAKMKGGLRSFSRYVPRDLVRTLLASGHTADLSGEVRELTIYFSDLAGFTSLSETRAPDELVQFLSEYFDDMSTIIMSEQGTVDKYMGDGIMAFWGAPLEVKNHAAQACIATLRCQRRVRELSEKGVSLATRIGLATGEVLVGNIGSTDRLNYTVMGDIANLASRLEGLNKQYGTDSMISEETFEQAREHVIARPIDVVAVKGKKQGVRVFELLALTSDNNATAQAVAEASTRALAAYLERRFAEAVAAWDEVLAKRPGDTAAGIMRDRAQLLALAPPPAEWSGVMVATSK